MRQDKSVYAVLPRRLLSKAALAFLTRGSLPFIRRKLPTLRHCSGLIASRRPSIRGSGSDRRWSRRSFAIARVRCSDGQGFDETKPCYLILSYVLLYYVTLYHVVAFLLESLSTTHSKHGIDTCAGNLNLPEHAQSTMYIHMHTSNRAHMCRCRYTYCF